MVQTPVKPQITERLEVINWLVTNNYPVLPVAPAMAAEQYPARDTKGEIKCDKQGNPIPIFTGKNPSYLDPSGKPHLVNHRQYQSQLPSDRELRLWFANPDNGVGTLGGWNNTIWLDFDVKQFASKEECDRTFRAKLEAHPELAETFLEESQSGGWRIGVRVKQKPNFTNFALALGGSHVGEALGEGRFTVLAPTIGPSGNSYKSINRAVPVEVETLESIGVHPVSTKAHRQALATPQPTVAYIPGSIPLEQLGNDTSREILQGSCPTGDRSEALTTALQEWYGWQNWTRENGIAVTGTPEDLAYYAGQQLGIDSDRVKRILKTIDIISSNPAALHRGGEESCWKKIRRLDKASFEAKCPAHIKDAIKKTELKPTNSTLPSGDGGDRTEEGVTEQNFWNAPVSWCGEIGWLFEKEVPLTEKDEQGNETPVIGEDGQPVTEKVPTFVPKANFDFVVERELESEEGGGVVLLIKRSLDPEQKRVIISSQDYGSVKDFEAALKRAYKSGVVCNLKSEHLKSLIHVKLREYRARGGITYRLQDRAGQQADGHWVFKDCQITKDGVWSAEPNSDWIFNENLGGEDKMPQPFVAPPNPNAIKRLVAAMRKFHGAEGIYPAMMALGFGGASLHYQTIMKIERRFPQVNLTGDPGTNKTVCAANGLSLVGWLNGDGLISGVSESKLYECLKLTGSLPLCLDDPPKSRELDEILKRLYNAVPRMVRGNYQEPHAPLMVTSNHAIGDQQLATLTRMLQIPVYRQTDGDPSAWDEMQEAMKGASGCLPDLIKLGYPKAEIKQLEAELRSHLPKSHPRIASSMALILWYAMAVAKLADFDAESIKLYAITQLCPSANAADTNSDSITDFLDKLSALKSEALVGNWNCQVVETKTGRTLAIQMSQVFPLIDRQFNPVYSRKVLEALIAKSGGTLQSVQKFHSNRDESLAYYRAKLTAEVDPKEPEYKPKRCVLVPFHLIKGFTDDWKPPTPPTDPIESALPNDLIESSLPTDPIKSALPNDLIEPSFPNDPIEPSLPNDPIEEPVTSPVTSVTPSYTQLHEKCNQQTVETELDSAVLDSLVTSFSERTTKEKQEPVESISFTSITNDLDEKQKSHTLISEKYVTEEKLEAVALIQTVSERLHISCNQDVTGCNQEEENVTEPMTNCQQLIANDQLPMTNCQLLKVGDRVNWSECPAHCESLSPFVIDEIEGDYAKLDLFAKLVPLVELQLAT